jgi:hypothetical protein
MSLATGVFLGWDDARTKSPECDGPVSLFGFFWPLMLLGWGPYALGRRIHARQLEKKALPVAKVLTDGE